MANSADVDSESDCLLDRLWVELVLDMDENCEALDPLRGGVSTAAEDDTALGNCEMRPTRESKDLLDPTAEY